MGKGKSKYPETLRVRVPSVMKQRAERILARIGHGDISEMARNAMVRWIEEEEKRLGLVPEAPTGAEG